MRRARTLLWIALALAGCEPPWWSEEPPDVRTRHLDLYVHDGATLCSDQLEDADDYLEAIARLLDVPIPPIQYHLHPSGAALARCGAHAAGCAAAGRREDGALAVRIDASSFFLYHEGAHALAASLGDPPAFLSEGLAVALTPHPPYYRYAGSRELSHVLTSAAWWSQPNPGELYARAGELVRYVIDRYGIERVLALYEALDHEDDEATILEAFEMVMGEPLDAVLASFAESESLAATIATDAVGVPQCASAGLELDGGVLEQVSEVPVCPPLGAPRLAGRARAVIEIPAGGVYVLELGARGVVPALHRCGDGELRMDRAFDLDPPDRVLLELDAGRHVLAFAPLDESAPVTLSWRLRRLEGDARSCDDAPLHTLTAEHPRVLFVGDPRRWPAHDLERGAAHLRIAAGERGVVSMGSGGGQSVASAGWCDACGGPCGDEELPPYGEPPTSGVVVEADVPATARVLSAPASSANVELAWTAE